MESMSCSNYNVTYRLCSEVESNIIYKAFMDGFSDYFIQMNMEEDMFMNYFFNKEGNQLEHSYVCFVDNIPAGVLFGGIRSFDGIKSLRCGALAIAPEYRGRGISKEMFLLHKEIGLREQCKQLCLEVLYQNERAISLYEKLGYVTTTILKYFNIETTTLLDMNKYSITGDGYDIIEEQDGYKIKDIIDAMEHHINWQQDTPTYEYSENLYLCVNHNDVLVGLLAASVQGRILYLWVKKEHRHKGIGTSLLIESAKMVQSDKLQVTVISNPTLEGFVSKVGFEKQETMQYEMIQPL